METEVVSIPSSSQTAGDSAAGASVTLHRRGQVQIHADPELIVRDCNVISLSESGCKIALREYFAGELSVGDRITLKTSIPPGLNLRARLATRPEIVPDWGCILVLSFCRIDEETYRHMIAFIRNLSADERERKGRRSIARDRRARKRKLRRKFLLAGVVAVAFGLGIVLFQAVTWLHTSGWAHARSAAESISALGKAAAMTDEQRLDLLKAKAKDGSLRELLQSLTPEDKKMLGSLLGGSGLLTPEKLQKLLGGADNKSGASLSSGFSSGGGFSATGAVGYNGGYSGLGLDAAESSGNSASAEKKAGNALSSVAVDSEAEEKALELLQMLLNGSSSDGTALSSGTRNAALYSLSQVLTTLTAEQKVTIAKTLGTDALSLITAATAATESASSSSSSSTTSSSTTTDSTTQTATDYLNSELNASTSSSTTSTSSSSTSTSTTSTSTSSSTSSTSVTPTVSTVTLASSSNPFGLSDSEYASLLTGQVPDTLSESDIAALKTRINAMLSLMTAAQRTELVNSLTSTQRALVEAWYDQ